MRGPTLSRLRGGFKGPRTDPNANPSYSGAGQPATDKSLVSISKIRSLH